MRRIRRLLNDLVANLSDLFGSAVRGWRAFFFTPADPTPLGLIRWIVGALVVWNLAVYGLDLGEALGPDGWVGPDLAREIMAERAPTQWTFWLWVPDHLVRPVWAACLVVAVLFTVGCFSRVTALLTWVIAISTARRALTLVFGVDQIYSALLFYLAFSGASGQALSVDRLLARRWRWRWGRARGRSAPLDPPPTVSANLGLRLIQLHICLIYGIAGLSKLQGPAWWSGRAAWMVVASPEHRHRIDLTWMADHPNWISLATHLTILVEVGFPIFIWIRPLRPLLLVAVIMMHMFIDLSLGLTEFGLLMVAGCLSFVSGPWLRALISGREEPAPEPAAAGG